jgi:hypothetical protein
MAVQSKTYRIVEGTSEPQDFQLYDDGVALDGTALTLGLKVYLNGALVETDAPTAAWLVQASGTVRVTGIENLDPGEYHVRYTLTDGANKVGFVPGGPNIVEADRWIIVPAHA